MNKFTIWKKVKIDKQPNLTRINISSYAQNMLDKIGISRELMTLYIQKKSKVGMYQIKAVLEAQKDFLREAFKKSVV